MPQTLNDPNNDDRADWGEVALKAFQKETRTDDENAVADLLCDLMHLCNRSTLYGEFEEMLVHARQHYYEELEEAKDTYKCQACGRAEDECSGNPCVEVIADREA